MVFQVFLVKCGKIVKKWENHTFREEITFEWKVDFSQNAIFLKCWFLMKMTSRTYKTIGNTWYFRHWRKVDFLWEKLRFRAENVKFPKKCDFFKKCFLFSVNFPIMPNLQEPEKCDFCVFTKNVRLSLKWLKYWKFHEIYGLLVKVQLSRPCRKYQVLPSVSIGILGTFRENT